MRDLLFDPVFVEFKIFTLEIADDAARLFIRHLRVDHDQIGNDNNLGRLALRLRVQGRSGGSENEEKKGGKEPNFAYDLRHSTILSRDERFADRDTLTTKYQTCSQARADNRSSMIRRSEHRWLG